MVAIDTKAPMMNRMAFYEFDVFHFIAVVVHYGSLQRPKYDYICVSGIVLVPKM